MNKHSWQIAFAYMSVVIGGGFASGNEVLQFFTGYGLAGVAGSVVSALLFAFLGMHIARISSIMQAGSHKQVLYSLFGKQAGLAIDILLSFSCMVWVSPCWREPARHWHSNLAWPRWPAQP